MRSSYLIFLAGFCLALAASACSSDDGNGAAGSGGSAGEGGSGGSAGSGGEGGAGPAIGGEFRTYNTLVPVLAGCETPDLSGNPGAGIDDITKCIIVTPPDISGFMTFTNTGVDAWDVTGRQDLTFKLEIQIGGADATITTNSSTAFTGTGQGSVADGGTLTLDVIEAPFNINATVTGTVTCEAFSNIGAGAACTVAADCLQAALGQTCTDGECDPIDLSAMLCPAANLDPGLNELPFDDDPGKRFFPVLEFADVEGELNMQMDGGPDDANGWYIGDPANGTQFTTLIGPVTVVGGAGGSGGSGGAGGAGGGN